MYSADDEGNTSVKHNNFIVDSEHPAGNQFLSYTQNVDKTLHPTQVQDSNFSVFFYDEEGELVACSFLRPILSDEDKELAANILALLASCFGITSFIQIDHYLSVLRILYSIYSYQRTHLRSQDKSFDP